MRPVPIVNSQGFPTHPSWGRDARPSFQGGATQIQEKFKFVETFKTWHADGTEFENAFLSQGSTCDGVWKDLGDGRVKLHYIGLMFALDGSISNIFTVDETDGVAGDGKTYKGNFAIRLWPPAFDLVGVGTPVQEIKGTTAATRITVD